MVEGAEIDWAAHTNDPVGVVSDVLAFDKAVAVAKDLQTATAIPPLSLLLTTGPMG